MHLLAKILIALVALEHLYILYMEMFQWKRFLRRLRGRVDDAFIEQTKAMGANQGLYNGFLAAGLIWSLCISDPRWSLFIAVFFLSCVAVAGLYGGWSVHRRIALMQALPAALALAIALLL